MQHKTERKKRRLKPRHIFLCCAINLVFLAAIVISQETKLGEITQQQQSLQEKYDLILLEEQRLERMLEYAQTDAYIEQLARERLGYVGEADYKFFRE